MNECEDTTKKKMRMGLTNVILLGLISCFADISSEMVYPIIPLYLTSVIGTSPAIVGVIEGIAESIASLLKVFSGYIADKYHNKKKIAFIGYSTGLIYKLTLLFATSWFGILIARIVDRIGKGIRTAPRDLMVTESSDTNSLGKSFGIHKALDMFGSAIGILISFFILKMLGDNLGSYRAVFIISIIPILIALLIFAFVKEKKCENTNIDFKKNREPFCNNIHKLDKQLKLYLFIVFIFTLGNSSNSFLILKASNVGFDSEKVILLYFLYNIVASILAIPIGKRTDKKGRKNALVFGYLMFSVVYLMFGFSTSKIEIIFAFAFYGIYTALIAGVERAFIAEIAPAELKGTMLGLHGTLVGIALLPASILAGLFWDKIGVSAPFVFGATMSLISAIALIFGLKTKTISNNEK